MNPAGALLHAKVTHRRPAGPTAPFAYPVGALLLPLSRLDAVADAGLAVNRWAPWSFHERDHGRRDGSALLPWIRQLLADHGLAHADGEVWLQCFPRCWGVAFNPVSFWFCHDAAGRLIAVLAEVRNTFGEGHNYLLARDDGRPFNNHERLTARKVFHVSPFFDVNGHYAFVFDGYRDPTVLAPRRVRIDYHGSAGSADVRLHTAIAGTAVPLDATNLRAARRRYRWLSLAIVARIHWQALKLWRRRVRFFVKPEPPLQETTR